MSESIHEPLPKTKTPESLPPPSPPPRVTAPTDFKQTLDAVAARHAPPREVEHVRAALGYVERSARDGLAKLEALTTDQSSRDALVVEIVVELGHATDDLAAKVSNLAPKDLLPLRDAANAGAEAVLRLRGWIRSRAPNAKMVEHVEASVRELDPVLRTLGVAPVGQRPTPALIDDETQESQAESKAVTEAAADLVAAITLEYNATASGIDGFWRDQMIEDDDDTSFVEAVAKSLLVAVVGHVIGEQVGKLLGNLAKRAHRTVSAKVMERFVNITTDYVQGFTGELVAAKQGSAKVETRKAENYFVMGLQKNAARLAFEQKRAVNALVAMGAGDPQALRAEAAAKAANAKVLAETYMQLSAQLWVAYRAQSNLGTHAVGVNGRKISNLTDYFGEHGETGRVFGTGRQGTHGVARLAVTVTPETGALEVGTFEIAGSNSVVAEHVAGHAGGQLDKIWLPKEVTVFLKQYRAVIAIDETNRVRDAIGWDDIARRFPEHAVLGSPSRFWNHVRGTKV